MIGRSGRIAERILSLQSFTLLWAVQSWTGHPAGQQQWPSFLGTPTSHELVQEVVFQPESPRKATNACPPATETSPAERGGYDAVSPQRLPPGVDRGFF